MEIQNPPGHPLSADVCKNTRKERLYKTHHGKWKGTNKLAEKHQGKIQLGDLIVDGSRVLK
jgi:hypothetical protein